MKTAKRRRRSAAGANPFGSSMTMFRVGMEMAELFSSSAQVIAHRSGMISQAFNGTLPLHHTEFTNMWQEKMTAGGESLLAAMLHLGSSHDGASYLSKILAPYRKKAAANARRLGKK